MIVHYSMPGEPTILRQASSFLSCAWWLTIRSFGDGRPPQMSNLCCLPGRAGGLPAMLDAPPPIRAVAGCDIQTEEETNDNRAPQADGNRISQALRQASQQITSARQLTLCFQRLANLNNGVFERLGRYEAAMARQVLRTLYLQQSAHAPSNRPARMRGRYSPG
jgi:hypothetical protein